MMAFAALQESRAEEVTRLIKRYRHLVVPSHELAQMPVVDVANGGRQPRAAQKLP
jgi:hypothetical protein